MVHCRPELYSNRKQKLSASNKNTPAFKNYLNAVTTSHIVQNIGSFSKTFIAVALMTAIELGYFTLETDINTILPFLVVNPNVPQQPIRLIKTYF
jgi:CubicO group peptidase (beta-lactamase class C family)